jgi:hypothetical protein
LKIKRFRENGGSHLELGELRAAYGRRLEELVC